MLVLTYDYTRLYPVKQRPVNLARGWLDNSVLVGIMEEKVVELISIEKL
jgi:hypothetical protein